MQWDKLRPKHLKIFGEGKRLGTDCTINIDVPIIKSTVEEAAARFESYADKDKGAKYTGVKFMRGIDTRTVNRINEVFGGVYVENDEGYFIDTTGEDIIVRSATERGLFYGAQAIAVFLEGAANIIPSLVAYEYPICPERGVKCYIPGVKHIAFFKKFVDMMCRYRHNTILIEVGGSMEYKRYPEINHEWVKFCEDVSEYSGKAIVIQAGTYPWSKDSMHVENGDGGFISQDMMRELVLYCKERYINVIPEVLSLSHCDYIVRAFPEIGERSYDPYPDTYCPSHPKTYRILFDILEEIIDVFEPEVVHVGHDEYYTYGICPRCKGRDPVDIFADDVNKLYDFLHERDIKMMLWADKFLNSIGPEGKPAGGANKPPHPAWANEDIIVEGMGPTYKSIDMVPRDIKMHHWYWSWNETYELEFLNRNMPTTYGNYKGTLHRNFKKRIQQGMLGGLCSNWSTLSESIMQWNGVIFETAFNGIIFWDPDYDYDLLHETLETTARDQYHWNNMDALYGEPAGNYIRVTHTTTREMPFEMIHCGIFLDPEKYLLGHYVITCDNGRQAKIPLHYAEHIASDTDRFEMRIGGTEEAGDGTARTAIDKLRGVSYNALIHEKDGKTWYEAVMRVPDYVRGFKITDVRFEQTAQDCEVIVEKVEVL